MSSKRQQARNERSLQDLIRSIPGNDVCADCSARNPGWASYSIGCFLCLRCAAIHRKMGTHISKVKSLSMDKWTDEQVDQMKTNGNTLVNKKYNPRNVRPKIPFDADEVDSVMERFIRQKYQEMSLSDGRPRPPSRHEREPTYEREAPRDREYNRSPENSPPPPLPPKKGKLFSFGLRSTSASYPYLSKADKKRMNQERNLTIEPTTENAFHSSVTSPLPSKQSKQSRIFGANVGDDANIETKLTTLKDMGFPDAQRNSTMLKSLNGDLERTIESLVRLGEGSQPGSRSRTPRGSMRGTPTASAFPDDVKSPTLKPPSGTNPFDRPSGSNVGLSLAPPSGEQKAGGSFNPFGIPPDPQVLEQSLNNLQISQQPPLFPHSTGGYPSQPPPIQIDRLQQSMTPPVPSTYNPFFQSMPSLQSSLNPYNQMMQTPQSATQTNNPFFGQGYGANNVAQSPQPIEQYGQSGQASYNPFQAQFLNQQAQQNVQPQSFQQPQQQPQQQQSTNPFGNNFGGQMAGGMPDLFSGGQTIQQQQQQQQQYPNFQQQSYQQQQPLQQQQQQPQPQAPQIQTMPNGYPQSQNPYQVQQPQQNPYQQPQPQQSSQFQSAPTPLMPQQTGRYDKSSILALYNYPHLAPPLPTIQDEPSPSGEIPPPSSSQQPPSTSTTTPQRSVTMPLPQQSQSQSQSRNPFLNSTPNPNNNNNTTTSPSTTTNNNVGSGPPPTSGNLNWGIANRSRSRESADLAAWQQQQNQNGRHSPDAIFGGLSARYGR